MIKLWMFSIIPDEPPVPGMYHAVVTRIELLSRAAAV